MTSPFVSKLQHGCELTDADRARLDRITKNSRCVGAKQDIISEGDSPDDVHLVMEGIACRYKVLPGGSRQIMALLLPGDFCDLHVAILGAMDHSIGSITDCKMVEIPRATIDELSLNEPRITRALWWASLVDEAILREWLVSMGGRPADKQLAHLLCELLLRLQVTGRADRDSYALPMTQEDLADMLGLSAVHVNRSLQKLRDDGLITLRAHRLKILDLPRLIQFGGFNPNYLHLRDMRRGEGGDTVVRVAHGGPLEARPSPSR